MAQCINPFMKGNSAHPCGRCLPCTINRRRLWTHRILLEASQYADNAFITLTYSDETLPSSGSLIREHLTLWLKRFRKEISPARVRFYAVGEYGSISQRPHYHIAMFGYANCRFGQSRLGLKERMVSKHLRCCSQCDLISDTWEKGGIFVGALEAKSAQYIAQYVTKKMTRHQDPRLNGRWPEFSTMSKQDGGLGIGAMHDVASEWLKFNLDQTQTDVPSVLRHGKKLLPVGRYLRGKLREMVGKEDKTPDVEKVRLQEELRPLQEAAKASSSLPSLKSQIIQTRLTQARSLDAREKIKKSKGQI